MLEFQINNQIVSGFIGIRNACTYLLNSRRRGSLSRFVNNISHFCQLAWKWKTFATAIIISMSIATATQPKFSTASQTILWFADRKKNIGFGSSLFGIRESARAKGMLNRTNYIFGKFQTVWTKQLFIGEKCC